MTGVAVSIAGTELSDSDQHYLTVPSVVGVVLFKENYASIGQLKRLTAAIHALRDDLVIMVDQEGGQVQRFCDDHFIALPSLRQLGLAHEQSDDKESVLTMVESWAYQNATSLLDAGVDLLLGPIADLHHPGSPIIGGRNRAFSAQVEDSCVLINTYLQGMVRAGMARGVLKHFPGHGAIIGLDSHHDQTKFDEIVPDLPVFNYFMQQPSLFGIMLAHSKYGHYDPNHVVGTSPIFHRMIREEIGYRGMIFSDCLSMRGAHFKQEDRLDSSGSSQIIFQKRVLELIRAYAPFHNVLIFTHLQTLWQGLMPNATTPSLATLQQWVLPVLKESHLQITSDEKKALSGCLVR